MAQTRRFVPLCVMKPSRRKPQKRERQRKKPHAAGDVRPAQRSPAELNELKIPPGAVLANPSQQVPNNSYSPPPLYYEDKPFTCVVCGRQEVWTAEQQKWYYELAKGSLFATAVRCRACRRTRRERLQG